MASRKLIVVAYFGWVMLGLSLLMFALTYYGVGPDWVPLVAVFFSSDRPSMVVESVPRASRTI
jgi:hypothetical protein